MYANDDTGDVLFQGHVMQQQSRRRLPSLHAIGRSRCVDFEDTPSEPAWLLPPPWFSSNHDVEKIDADDEDEYAPPTRYASVPTYLYYCRKILLPVFAAWDRLWIELREL